MSTLVLDAIAAEIATLERLVPTPTPPLGWGSDLSCVTDLTLNADEVSGEDSRSIGEALLRRLTCARGMLMDDADYGIDVLAYANAPMTLKDQRDLAGTVTLECQKDDRVDSVIVDVTQPEPNHLSINVRVSPVDPDIHQFTLTFAVVSGALVVEAFA